MTPRLKAAAMALVVLAIYLLRINAAAGLMVDDAYYIMLARALADGEGYRLVNSGTTAMVPLYPPGFPLILSLVFRLAPEFPDNAWLLKVPALVAMAGVGLLTFFYAVRRGMARDVAAGVAVAVSIVPALVFLATSTVMSECVFTFFQLATVVLMHRAADASDGRRGAWAAALGGGTAAYAVLVRSAGIGLLVAAALYLVKERRARHALVFGVVSVSMLLPWMVYSRLHAPTAAEQEIHGGSIVYSYGEQVWMRWAGDPASGNVTFSDMPARVATNLVDVFGRGMGGIIAPALFRGATESGEEIIALGGAAGLTQGSMGSAPATLAISLLLSGIVAVGFVQMARRRVTPAELLVPISLGIILLWPFWTFRFIVPLAPFLFLYLVSGIQTVCAWLGSRPALGERVVRMALLTVVGLNLLDHAAYLYDVRSAPASGATIAWLEQARETDAALDWVKGNLREGVIATTNPGLVYLRTGHRTISFDRLHGGWDVWRQRGVRYVVCLLAVQVPPATDGMKVLYRSPGGFWIVEI